LVKKGLADGVGHELENSSQIVTLSDLTEHLPDKEGIGRATAAGGSYSRWKWTLFYSALSRSVNAGDRFWGQDDQVERKQRLRKSPTSPAF